MGNISAALEEGITAMERDIERIKRENEERESWEELLDMIHRRDLFCNICQHFLSVPPIIYNASTGIICGRCTKYVYEKNYDPNIHRQIFYEQIAERLKFLCMYRHNGCTQKVAFQDMKKHEESCSHRITLCIFSLEDFKKSHKVECDWKGPIEQFTKHAKEEHYDKFHDISAFFEFCDLLKNFFIFFECSDNVFLFVCLYNESENKCTFMLMSDPSTVKSVKSYKLIFLNDKMAKFSCSPHQYYNKIITKTKSIETLGWTLDLSKIKSILNTEVFVQLVLNLEGNINLSSNLDSNEEAANDTDMPICYYAKKEVSCRKILLPPIYSCHKNHNICGKCFEKRKSCCNETNFRNHAMEKFLLCGQRKCENEKCQIASSILQIGFHQQVCSFRRLKKCFKEYCGWMGENLKDHIKTSHDILESYREMQFLEGSDSIYFAFEEHIFVLKVSFASSPYFPLEAKFQLICLETTEFLYNYEIEISCSDSPYSKLSFKNLAEPQHLPTIVHGYEGNDIKVGSILSELFSLADEPLNSLRYSLKISLIDQ